MDRIEAISESKEFKELLNGNIIGDDAIRLRSTLDEKTLTKLIDSLYQVAFEHVHDPEKVLDSQTFEIVTAAIAELDLSPALDHLRRIFASSFDELAKYDRAALLTAFVSELNVAEREIVKRGNESTCNILWLSKEHDLREIAYIVKRLLDRRPIRAELTETAATVLSYFDHQESAKSILDILSNECTETGSRLSKKPFVEALGRLRHQPALPIILQHAPLEHYTYEAFALIAPEKFIEDACNSLDNDGYDRDLFVGSVDLLDPHVGKPLISRLVPFLTYDDKRLSKRSVAAALKYLGWDADNSLAGIVFLIKLGSIDELCSHPSFVEAVADNPKFFYSCEPERVLEALFRNQNILSLDAFLKLSDQGKNLLFDIDTCEEKFNIAQDSYVESVIESIYSCDIFSLRAISTSFPSHFKTKYHFWVGVDKDVPSWRLKEYDFTKIKNAIEQRLKPKH